MAVRKFLSKQKKLYINRVAVQRNIPRLSKKCQNPLFFLSWGGGGKKIIIAQRIKLIPSSLSFVNVYFFFFLVFVKICFISGPLLIIIVPRKIFIIITLIIVIFPSLIISLWQPLAFIIIWVIFIIFIPIVRAKIWFNLFIIPVFILIPIYFPNLIDFCLGFLHLYFIPSFSSISFNSTI
ncbi:unnamed protein product [Meloidogyne enterolobii]|uniref:Uncharacterized protein n=1 Tax=Meloidogyne enterolobii TaxID=390850 RepID=A0ACB0Z0Q9_MELEN